MVGKCLSTEEIERSFFRKSEDEKGRKEKIN